MSKKIVVLALGGNAILKREDRASIDAQFDNVKKAALGIKKLSKKYKLVITHGNGPQVGNILIRSEAALGAAYKIPLHVAVAESEGEIGYIIQQVLQNELRETVVSMLTQVIVNKNDKAFSNPTKPVGPFYNKHQATLLRKSGMAIKKVENGYRHVVASPLPLKIVESKAIKKMCDSGFLVVAAGGGGIPVVKEKKKLHGIDAVIDKDLAAARLAQDVGADALFLLTDVDCVYLNFGKKNQRALKCLSHKDAKRYLDKDEFPEGSMGPKIRAALQFLRSNKHGSVTIGSVNNPEKGTKIQN